MNLVRGGYLGNIVGVKMQSTMVKEGGNFFPLRIFKQGKYFMQSIFMGKNAA